MAKKLPRLPPQRPVPYKCLDCGIGDRFALCPQCGGRMTAGNWVYKRTRGHTMELVPGMRDPKSRRFGYVPKETRFRGGGEMVRTLRRDAHWMERQQGRDSEYKAFKRGREDFLAGIPREKNPFREADRRRDMWFKAWDDELAYTIRRFAPESIRRRR